MDKNRKERILILAKTYPSPSAQYVETSCIAGISEDGSMRRLYPVPFRMLDDSQQFKKWQWIDVRIEKANKDHRPESHKLYVDTITCGDVIDTTNEWATRREWLNKIPAFDDFDAIELRQLGDGLSLALLRPMKLIALEITKARTENWTEDEKEKLMRAQMQDDIFSEADAKRQVRDLRKVPFDFYYLYMCESPKGERMYKHKIVDWEAGALFWKCKKSHGINWEVPFRAKLEEQFRGKDLMFLMGNQHRFQKQWLIISLIYPAKRKPVEVTQGSLF